MPSVGGLISGLDTTTIIRQLLAIQSKPIQILQARAKSKTTQQTEVKSLTAKLLSLKMDAALLGKSSTFEAKKVASSNEAVLSATVDSSAAEGAYTFTVGKLAKTSQALSNGFAAKNTAIGKGDLTLETGNGFVDSKTRVDFLNGGTGIDRGTFKLTDGAGNNAVVDVSASATLQDVLDAINTGATKITASLSADGLVLTDASAVPGITVSEVAGKTTAADLGLTGVSTLNGRLTGSRINKITGATRLDDLNDGLGVRTSYEAGTGASATDLNFVVRSGASFTVDLNAGVSTSPTTVQDVLNAINNAAGNAGKVTASISTDGQSLTMTDNTAGAGVLTVTALNSANALQDLGLRGVTPENLLTGLEDAANGNRIVGKRLIPALNSTLARTLNGAVRQFAASDTRGVADGSIAITDRAGTSTTVNLSSRVQTTLDAATLVGDTSVDLASGAGFAVGNLLRVTNGASTVLRRVTAVNYATGVVSFDQAIGVAFGAGSAAYAANESLSEIANGVSGRTAGVITAAFNAERNGLKLTDTGSGTGLLRIAESGSTTADDLGVLTGGITAATVDALGTTTTFTDAALVGQKDRLIGLQVEVTAGTNTGYSGTILDFNDTTGLVTLATAAAAAFDATSVYNITGVDASSFNGRDTDPAYLSERTKLSSFNGGKGVFAGSIRITDREGKAFTVDLSQETRLGEAINDINAAATAATSVLTARVNDTGDGILLTSSAGAGTIKVEEVSGGTTARDLNLLKTSSTSTLDGTFEYTVTIGASDTLETLRDAINALKANVTATIVQDGNPSAPYRLNLTSQRSGLAGKLVVDPQRLNLSFQVVSEGEDAALLFGSGSGGGKPVLFTSSSNTASSVVPGMTVTLKAVSGTPVTATVTRDTGYVADQVNDFVANFNTVVDAIKSDIRYLPDTQERGILNGNASIVNLQNDLYRTVLQQIPKLPGDLNGMENVGVKLATTGTLTFDRTRFLDKLAADFKGVKKLFVQGADITGGTALSSLRNGKGARVLGTGVSELQVRKRSGTVFQVALTDAKTVQAVLTAINNATGNGGQVVASVSSDGTGITFVDTSVGTSNLTVTALNSSRAAEDLGILKSASFVTGSTSTTLKGNAVNSGGIGTVMEARFDYQASDEKGILFGANNILEEQIQDLNDSIQRLQVRLDSEQKRLEAQFTKLETTLSNLQATSQFVGLQLQALISQQKGGGASLPGGSR